MSVSATSRLRMVGYCLLLAAIAFIQAPGRIVADTKLDLAVDPGGFLARAADLWDPLAAFGQLQNQAYGYFWPMGPFFLLGDVTGIPTWVTQRLWWTLLLCLAFVGTVKLAQALRIGRPWAQVLAGFAFALSVHMLTLLGPTSVEAWPSALAPWVLLPLVRASSGGSPRRAAALSALVVASAGGVNAVAVSAVLPLGVAWLLTRTGGPRRRALFLWWTGLTVLATLWWVVPLLILGRYSVPFLDYIENAPITTLPTSLPDVLAGSSDWVAYISPQDWYAGNLLATTPFLIVNAAVIAALGLAGIARPDNPHRHFLALGLLLGVALVGFGYTGDLHGWWAEERQALLDAELAPFRNLHKYDVVLRLPIVLGMAHFVSVFQAEPRLLRERLIRWAAVVAAAVSVAGVAAPAYAGQLAPEGSFKNVPTYWEEAARYLGEQEDGLALEIPASAFGDYIWGRPHDDVLQPLAASPWAVRNIVPLAQPGNVRLLDAVTEVVESGRPSSTLADFLAANGIGRLVVRNDLAFTSDAPDPVVLHQALDRSPGLHLDRRNARFGPYLGSFPISERQGNRWVANRGRQAGYYAIEVYEVTGTAERVTAWEVSSVPVVSGTPSAGLTWGERLLAGPSVLIGDRSPAFDNSPVVATDGLKRRETAFTAVRHNTSATMAEGEDWALSSVVPNHRLYDDQARWETVTRWWGVDRVTASSAQSDASTLPPVRRDRSPAAAVDGFPGSSWVSGGLDGAVGQWWRVDLRRPADLDEITVRMGPAYGRPVTALRLTTSQGTEPVEAPSPGRVGVLDLPEGGGVTDFVKIEALRVPGGGEGHHFALAEVALPGVEIDRALALPPTDSQPDRILLARDQGRSPCVETAGPVISCNDTWAVAGEDFDSLQRVVPVARRQRFDLHLSASVRQRSVATRALAAHLPVRVETSSDWSRHPLAGGLAAVDDDPTTAWVARSRLDPDSLAPPRESMTLRWDRPVRLSRIAFDLRRNTPAAFPTSVTLLTDREGQPEDDRKDERATVRLDDGVGEFEPFVTDEVTIRFDGVEQAFFTDGLSGGPLPVGVAEVSFPGARVPTIDRHEQLDLGCGSGPEVMVNGVRTQTRVASTLARLMAGEPVRVLPCGEGTVELEKGENRIGVSPSRLMRPETLRLVSDSVPALTRPQRVSTAVRDWTATERTVEVSDRDQPTLLVVAENANDGWVATLDGEELQPQRVDGWKQGWVLPAGAAGEVRLAFTPNGSYQAGLLGGAVPVLLVLLAALLPARRRPAPALRTAAVGPLVVAVGVLVAGLTGGWVAAAAAALAVAVSLVAPVATWAGLLAGGLVAAAGAVHALARADELRLVVWPAQLLALLALAAALGALGTNGPRFFRRSSGRSST
ncbi:alpha-(1-_3)-arabinofuranosyltransferase domain-containing protein [Nocardioides pakistanensis]